MTSPRNRISKWVPILLVYDDGFMFICLTSLARKVTKRERFQHFQ